MPIRPFYSQPVPPKKPDRCKDCPFLGIVPQAKRKKGSKLTMLCMATMKAISHESISISEEERRGTKHPHNRPCDGKYHVWLEYPRGIFPLSKQVYRDCRVPYEQGTIAEYEIDFG